MAAEKPAPRMQCKECPWRKGANPRNIPGEYCEKKHEGLERTIAKPGDIRDITTGGLRMMACHETVVGKELPCVGWLVHQIGIGQNLGLRLAALNGQVDMNVRTVGPQHERFEDTLPKKKRRKKKA
jgi:hypothetical protein